MSLSEEKLCEIYSLNECIDWIQQNNYGSISLQFSKDSLELSSSICLFLQKRIQTKFYISYSTMCCVDYLSAQHLNESTVDSIIFFGSVCLTTSQFSDSLPVLYVFPNNYEKQSIDFIESSIIEMKSNKVIILYDTSHTLLALEVFSKCEQNNEIKGNVLIAKLNNVSNKWYFTPNVSKAVENSSSDSHLVLGPFSLPDKIQNYDLVVYLGQCSSLELTLNCPRLLEIDVKNGSHRLIYGDKQIRKRVALIEKFKLRSCHSVGVVFTNPLPNVNQFFSESKRLCKKMKKKLYLISLLQTIDEYKLGNFGELNAFVVINSCFCSNAIDSINYCLPVLNWSEFEIAAGLPKQYGGILWNQTQEEEEELSDSDETDVNDLNNQLIQTEFFDKNKWFGLEVNAGDSEAAVVKSGQTGIASEYENENLL